MPNLSIYLDDDTDRAIRAVSEVEGISLGKVVARAFARWRESPGMDTTERLEDHERRIGALEEMAENGR